MMRFKQVTTRKGWGYGIEGALWRQRFYDNWYGYYRHGRWTTYCPLDGYVRGRLRSILRKRMGKKGRGRGTDRQRWPNAYFDAQGLFTMIAARKAAGYSR